MPRAAAKHLSQRRTRSCLDYRSSSRQSGTAALARLAPQGRTPQERSPAGTQARPSAFRRASAAALRRAPAPRERAALLRCPQRSRGAGSPLAKPRACRARLAGASQPRRWCELISRLVSTALHLHMYRFNVCMFSSAVSVSFWVAHLISQRYRQRSALVQAKGVAGKTAAKADPAADAAALQVLFSAPRPWPLSPSWPCIIRCPLPHFTPHRSDLTRSNVRAPRSPGPRSPRSATSAAASPRSSSRTSAARSREPS